MSVPGVFDLSSVLYAQSQYLDDLGGYVQTAGTQANDVAVYVNNLQSKLNNLYNVYNTANQNTQQVIDKQATMSRILAAENDRLQQKQAVIDNKLVGTKRMIELNESARKRMAEYQKIIIVIVVTLILYILIIYANRFFPYVPQVWFDVFIAILFTASLIMIGNIIYRIYGRNNMNFDRIDLNPPKNATNQAKTSSGNNDGENLGDILQSALNSNQCSGQACCAVGTSYDKFSNLCIIPNSDPTQLYDATSSTLAYVTSSQCTTAGKQVCGNSCISSGANCYN